MKKAKTTINPSKVKRPITEREVESSDGKHPIWSFVRFDESTPWLEVEQVRDMNLLTVIKKLRDLERTTWREIKQSSGGKRSGTNSHYIDISSMSREAKRHAKNSELNEDSLFSLRIDGRCRFHGIIDGETFYLIWFDPDHKVCPTSS